MDADEDLLAQALSRRGFAVGPERLTAALSTFRSLRERLRRLSEALPERAELPPTRLEPPRP